jgi:hypothetical protein
MPRYYKVKVSVSLVTGPYILSFLLIHLNKTGCFFLMLLINVSHFSFSQSNFSHFEHINSENGLPQNSVYVICQDKQGFMWFGTADGLCRYDGNEIRVFRKDPFDTNSLPGNFIRRLISDSKGILWIGTESGICCYDPVTEKFKRVHIPGESDITSVAFPFYETKSGEIFFGWNNKKYFKINQHNWVVKEETFSSKIKE